MHLRKKRLLKHEETRFERESKTWFVCFHRNEMKSTIKRDEKTSGQQSADGNDSDDGSARVMDGQWMVIGRCEHEDEVLWSQNG